MLEWMSKGQDATAPSIVDGRVIPPLVEVLEFSDNMSGKDLLEMSKKIRKIIASGRAVAIVPRHPGPLFEWDREVIAQLTSGLPEECRMRVRWQSKHVRTGQVQKANAFKNHTATQKRHRSHKKHRNPKEKSPVVDLCDEGTVSEFLDAVDAGTEPVNCLDVPQAAGHSPTIIK